MTCTFHSTRAGSVSASESSTCARARAKFEETQLTQITVQVGTMEEVLPTVPLIEACYASLSSQEVTWRRQFRTTC